MSEQARGAARLRLAARGRVLAWAQADALGSLTELERAEFLLRRLHPTLTADQLRQILEQLAAAQTEGMWHGFARPPVWGEDGR